MCALLKTMNRPRARKELSLSGSGRMQKGTVNVAKVGTAACKSRAVSSARADSFVTGYHRYQGEERRGDCPSHLKSVLDVSVGNHNPPLAEGISPEPGWCVSCRLGVPRMGTQPPNPERGASPVRSGIEQTTYRAKGRFNEQGNFDSDAWLAMPGKPPSPVLFRAEDGALVVVGARESRVHGEGEQ